jgi:cytosine permease
MSSTEQTAATAPAQERLEGDIHLGRDDFALHRVPDKDRHHWFVVALQRFGQVSALSQFLLGATLGFGMDFWPAFWAFTLGAVILEIVSIFTGIAGQREGLNTSMLVRWTGFGRYGSTLLGLIITISLMGWFGVQNAVFASGLDSLLPHVLPIWAWEILCGAVVTVIVMWGFLSMSWTAFITVPAFLALCIFSIGVELSRHPFDQLVASGHAGPALSIPAGATLVAGGFIVGAVITPDMSRFNRNPIDVVKQTVVGFTVGEYTIGMIGVLLAHAAKTADVIGIVTTTSGVIGVLVLVAATLKINDWNLYSGSLGLANFIDTLVGRRVHRGLLTLVVGALGTALSAAGILQHFIGFLTLLGVAFPPVASIMVVDYYLLRTHRKALNESAANGGRVPSIAPGWNVVGLVSWLVGSVAGWYIQWGLGSVNSLVIAAVVYFVGSKLVGMLRRPGSNAEVAA